MPEPVSTVSLCFLGGYAALNAYVRGSSAISDAANAARKAACAVVESVERSQALFGEKAVAIAQLRTLAMECAQEDWNGEGALAIDSRALANAEAVVRALPQGVLLPEFAPEPDGSVSLDWIASRTRLFSLSIGPGPRLAYAWLDGADKGHGVATFDGLHVPARVLEGIRSILNHGNTPLRAT